MQPDREDERARIEAAGGKVIQWDGFRVSGVLAMSRSIGMYIPTLTILNHDLAVIHLFPILKASEMAQMHVLDWYLAFCRLRLNVKCCTMIMELEFEK